MQQLLSRTNLEKFIKYSFLFFIAFQKGILNNVIIQGVAIILLLINIVLLFTPEWRAMVFTLGECRLNIKRHFKIIIQSIYFVAVYFVLILNAVKIVEHYL